MADFDGFPKDTLAFLAELSEPDNNHKPWFDANRKRYEEVYVAPAKAFVSAVGERLHAELSPEIQAIPGVQKGSMMRINRDIRFSKDKRPYKDHMDLWFWVGEGRSQDCPGLGFRLMGDSLGTVGGKHGFDKDALAAFRKAVDHPTTGEQLAAIVEHAVAKGAVREEPHYKTVPRGFDPDHPRSELMRMRGMFLGMHTEVPEEVHSAAIVDLTVERFRPVWPLVSWLAAVLGSTK